MHTIAKLISKSLVRGLPHFKVDLDYVCDACQLGKQTRESFKLKNVISTTRPLELLHMDLFGPTRITSLGGMKYGLVIVDDFLDSHGYYLSHIKMKPLMRFKNFI